ncbi:MAG: hypothetical protein KatS3mg105_0764 [Gemmatales bacterium]|nr:MAG: hypothetical protein KatS3mg105_0764 [Gemmatales bacterium]
MLPTKSNKLPRAVFWPVPTCSITSQKKRLPHCWNTAKAWSVPQVPRWAASYWRWGRFQLANDRERFTSAAPNLLSSLKNLKEKQPLGLVGMLLMGRAYLELGLDDRAIVLFEKELAAAQPGDLADEMGYLLAEAYQREAQPTLAKKYLEPIVARNGMWSGVARFSSC